MSLSKSLGRFAIQEDPLLLFFFHGVHNLEANNVT